MGFSLEIFLPKSKSIAAGVLYRSLCKPSFIKYLDYYFKER